jgi:hypothetical protein
MIEPLRPAEPCGIVVAMRKLVLLGLLFGCKGPSFMELELQCGTDHIQSACVEVVRRMREGCDRSEAQMCGNLSVSYINGSFGLSKDPAKGKEIAQRACSLGDESSCMALPHMR